MPAIAVQWNKDGVHYVVVAEGKDPIDEELVLRMANSLER